MCLFPAPAPAHGLCLAPRAAAAPALLSLACRYRPRAGFRRSLASLFSLHNETGNVWSHLLGCVLGSSSLLRGPRARGGAREEAAAQEPDPLPTPFPLPAPCSFLIFVALTAATVHLRPEPLVRSPLLPAAWPAALLLERLDELASSTAAARRQPCNSRAH